MIRKNTEAIFVKKECDMKTPNILGAVITSASKMARVSDIVSEQEVIEVLCEAYGVSSEDKAAQFIGMGSQYVQGLIGYSVDYNDFGAASAEYAARKNIYDAYYNKIASMTKSEQQTM